MISVCGKCLIFVFMNSITIDNITIGYDGKAIASGLSATLRSGCLTCLIGRNGLGKTTLLRTLSGFMPPISGKITLHTDNLSTDLWQCSKQTLARLVAVVLTEKPELNNITVSDVVAMGRMPYTNFLGTMTYADRRVVEEALAITGITDFASRDFSRLSDGERQRVMIARALAQQTPVIILDEPTAFLDYNGKVDTMNMLAKMAKTLNKIIVVSSHDLGIVVDTADRIVTIDNGIRDIEHKKLKEALSVPLHSTLCSTDKSFSIY